MKNSQTLSFGKARSRSGTVFALPSVPAAPVPARDEIIHAAIDRSWPKESQRWLFFFIPHGPAGSAKSSAGFRESNITAPVQIERSGSGRVNGYDR